MRDLPPLIWILSKYYSYMHSSQQVETFNGKWFHTARLIVRGVGWNIVQVSKKKYKYISEHIIQCHFIVKHQSNRSCPLWMLIGDKSCSIPFRLWEYSPKCPKLICCCSAPWRCLFKLSSVSLVLNFCVMGGELHGLGQVPVSVSLHYCRTSLIFGKKLASLGRWPFSKVEPLFPPICLFYPVFPGLLSPYLLACRIPLFFLGPRGRFRLNIRCQRHCCCCSLVY